MLIVISGMFLDILCVSVFNLFYVTNDLTKKKRLLKYVSCFFLNSLLLFSQTCGDLFSVQLETGKDTVFCANILHNVLH
jgi:hypothetical protein